MDFMEAQDELGKKLRQERELKKMKQQSAEGAKEQAKQDMKQHEENKKEGMI